jgi:nicotinamide-nucleotide amidase
MDIEIVTIGDELLLGFTIDTNAAFIARQLSSIGIRIVHRATVGDEAEHIQAAVRAALDRTGAVITTGGLGPTADDKTKPAIASLFAQGMIMNDDILARLEERWRKRFGQELPISNRQQAMVPEHAEILTNNHGSAPGIKLHDAQQRWVVMLPGVPREMRGMMTDTVLPMLRTQVGENPHVILSRTLRTANIAESALADRLGELARGVDGLPLAFLPGNDGVDLRLTSSGRVAVDATQALDRAANAIRGKVGRYIYGEGDDDLASLMLNAARARKATIAVAESCTGGLLGMRFTAISGSSSTFMGGVIAYDNAVKVRDLGVDRAMLVEHGAVSEQVAVAMATGVRTRFNTTVGIGITGVAGPDGGSDEKPVGTVWVAVDLDGEVHAVRGVLPGDRAEIRWRAAQLALDRLRRAFERETDVPAWTVRG